MLPRWIATVKIALCRVRLSALVSSDARSDARSGARVAALLLLLTTLCVEMSAKKMFAESHTTTPAILNVSSSSDEYPRDYAGLRNVVVFNRALISGSAPQGAQGFASLAALGIKTILSVDGAIPDTATARSCGLRIVHLPIGYDGFDDARKAELVRAVRDLAKPIYIHCHHGKHRSAAAAGVIAVSLGWCTTDQAAARMKVSGTGAGYPGLWACVANSSVMSMAQIDEARDEFPAITRAGSLVDAMVELDALLDRVKEAARRGATNGESASVPANSLLADASLLSDRLRALAVHATTDLSGDNPPRGKVARWSDQQRALFQRHLIQSATLATSLENSIAAAEISQLSPFDAGGSDAVRALSASCTACHEALRDARAP